MKIAILGGGISGLSAAYFLLQKNPEADVTLFEASHQLGGWMQTTKIEGFVFERGPRTFSEARSPLLLQLISDLGLQKDLIYSDPQAKKRYLWEKGKLRPISSFWPKILSAFGRYLLTFPRIQDETIYDFGCRRFGKEATELFLDAMAKGVYAGDIRQLSVRSCFPFLCQAKRDLLMKGLLRKPDPLFTLSFGMDQLIHALANLPMTILLQARVEKIESKGVHVNGDYKEADLIICALPAEEAARLTGAPLSLRSESFTVVNLGYKKALPLRGYGYLVPSRASEPLLGMIWDSSIFPVVGQTKLTAMVKEEDPLLASSEAVRRHLRVHEAPDFMLTQEAKIPQYDLHHAQTIARFERAVAEKFPRMRLLGNYFSGPSVEACLQRAKKLSH